MRALITGANRGIGAEIRRVMSQRGDEVLATARDGVDFIPLDVVDPDAHLALARRLEGQTIDLLICNAGIYPDKDENLADGYPADMWDKTFAANVTGVFLTVQSLLPNLQLARAPKIAIISSQMASQKFAPGGSYIYRASKAAVLNLGRNLASDLKAIDIAVGIYHPGWVQTDMGGAAGEITVQQSALGLVEQFDGLSLNTTGCFLTWDGRRHPY